MSLGDPCWTISVNMRRCVGKSFEKNDIGAHRSTFRAIKNFGGVRHLYFVSTQELRSWEPPKRDRVGAEVPRVCQSRAGKGSAATCTVIVTRARNNTAETGDESVAIWLQCRSAEWSPSLAISPSRTTDLNVTLRNAHRELPTPTSGVGTEAGNEWRLLCVCWPAWQASW